MSSRPRTTSLCKEDAVHPVIPDVAGVAVVTNNSGEKIVTVAAKTSTDSPVSEVRYKDVRVLGSGSFGIVTMVHLLLTDEPAAVKKVLQDRRFKNRELSTMLQLKHQNVVSLKYFFYTETAKNELYLNLILEYLPSTLYQTIRQYAQSMRTMPLILIKLFSYQLCRGVSYLHSIGICHRDIKPQNVLVDPSTGVLKICDFGSAKRLMPDEPNVSYICSRYYRAPELILGATNYSCAIDTWSVGCVIAEMLLGRPLFAGETNMYQLLEIIKYMGAPTMQQLEDMSPTASSTQFPKIKAHDWKAVFHGTALPLAVELIGKTLVYSPNQRISLIECLLDPLFDELRREDAQFTDGRPLPQIFNFTKDELHINPLLSDKLISAHLQTVV
jgi:glycogen synthase kinase 3 beta